MYGGVISLARSDQTDAVKSRTHIRDGSSLPHVERYFEGYVALFLLMIITILVLADVANRIVFANQLVWGLEVIEGLFIWLVWLSASFAVRHSSHLRFTLLRERWSVRRNYIMYWVEWVLWFIVVGTIFWHSIPELSRTISANRLIVGTSIPDAIFYLAIPVGMGLLLARVGQEALQVTRAYRAGKEIAPDPSIETEGDGFSTGDTT